MNDHNNSAHSFTEGATVPPDVARLHQAQETYEQAERCFLEASAPFRDLLVRLHALYSEPRMLVRSDGSVEGLPSRLPADVQALADTIQQSIDQIREMCFADILDRPFPVSKP